MFEPQGAVEFVDTEIAGDVIRVITDGVPVLNATDPDMALHELREQHEKFRRFVLDSPRGHSELNAALLLPAFTSGAHRTLVVASQFGFVPLAGTPLIAAASVLAHGDSIAFAAPTTEIVFDTANGPMTVSAFGDSGFCRGARWCTTPSTFLKRNYNLELESGHAVPIDVVLTGLAYVVVTEHALGVDSTEVDAIGAFGAEISRAAGLQLPMKELNVAGITSAYPVLVIGEPSESPGKTTSIPLAWVYANGTVAKMPAGTGALTAAAVAVDRKQIPCGTVVTAVSPFGGEIRSSVGEFGQQVTAATTAMVEADVTLVAAGHLFGFRA